MPTTSATAIGTFVGACVRCGTRYFAESEIARNGAWCRCRAGVRCPEPEWRCLGGIHDHPQTAIRWKAVAGRVSATRICNVDCVTARGEKCTCSCGGANHGYGLARAERDVAAHST